MSGRLAILGYGESKELYECLRSCVRELASYCHSCGHRDCDRCPIDSVKVKLIMTTRYIQRRLEEEERKLHLAMQELNEDFWTELELIKKDLEELLSS